MKMMKVAIFFDVHTWTTSAENLYPFVIGPAHSATKKEATATRYCVTVEVPHPVQDDVQLAGVATVVEGPKI